MVLTPLIIAAIIVGAIFFLFLIVTSMLRTVEAGTIRLVSWFGGTTKIYKGPGKSKELPLLSTGTTIPAKAINIDLDISDQTADVDRQGLPRPIKVRVLASAIVSVGDSNETIQTAANRFFAMPPAMQTSTLTDLLTSTGRRAINLLHHDELFNAKASFPVDAAEESKLPVRPLTTSLAPKAEDDDRLAIIIKSACSRELQDLGLVFNSLNIKSVQSDVADARRRQAAVEAQANADIVQAEQERRSKEAQLSAEQSVNDKQRDLEQRRAQNAAIVATAEAEKQDALEHFRSAELRATQIAQATADAERVRVQAEAQADAEAIKITKVAAAQAEAIRAINEAIAEGGDSYLALRQLEMIPQIAPAIASALAQAKLVTISSDGKGAATGATDQITSVIQTILAAQLVSGVLKPDQVSEPQPEPEHPVNNHPQALTSVAQTQLSGPVQTSVMTPRKPPAQR